MRLGLISLGCPKNLVDSEVMLGLAERAGHEITSDPAMADVLVVNTCAFIDDAKQESIDTVLEMARHKIDGRCRRLIVTGCLAERYRDELRGLLPEVDAVLGTGDVPDIVEAIEGREPAALPLPLFTRDAAGRPRALTPTRVSARHRAADGGSAAPLPTYLYDAATPRLLTTPRHYAYVKVAEGCDYNCAFCIIPKLRGAYRSRPADSIVAEAESLAARGVRELLLVSQDTTYYGVDRQERHALAALLRRLDRVDGLHWIRLLYLYPTTVTAETLDAIAESAKVCRYIDMPLQHAADAMLKRMRRPGTRRSYERLIELMRRRMPDVAIRTTFMTGFPGETDAEFDELLDFVSSMAFDHVGVFTYSHEEGTAAFGRDDDVPDAIKRERRETLMARQRQVVAEQHAAWLGRTVEVLVDGPSAEHELVWTGRLASQAPDIDAIVYFSECDPGTLAPGAVVRGTVTDARGYDMVVHPLPDTPSTCYAVRSDG